MVLLMSLQIRTKSPKAKGVIFVGSNLIDKLSLVSSQRDTKFVFKIKKLSTMKSNFLLICVLFFPQNLCLAVTLSRYVLYEDILSTRDKQLLPKNITSVSTSVVITQQAGIILSQKLSRNQEVERHHQLAACESSSWG